MRYGIVSDIHSNLEALEVALDSLRDVDTLYCLGDIVGYGPNPNECCELMRDRQAITIIGNHDSASAGLISLDWFNPAAKTAAEWTRNQLSTSNLFYLRSLHQTHYTGWAVMVHGSLNNPENFEYIIDRRGAKNTFDVMLPDNLCLIGHTHISEFYSKRIGENRIDQLPMTSGGFIYLNQDFLSIVNCGSVGQPRDGNRAASFGIYDTDERTIEIRRREYSVDVTQQKMREAGLPERLWTRLEYGM
ncbi:MAG: metallophosphoesterase family protein [Armatimonadota bacterium]